VNKLRTILFTLLLVISSLSARTSEPQLAENGYLRLDKVNDFDQQVFYLNGTWHFYGHQLFNPADIQKEDLTAPFIPVTIPGIWTDYIVNNQKMGHHGFGTYRLQITIPEGFHDLAIYVPELPSASKIFINNKLITQNGIPGTSKSNTKPYWKPDYYHLHTETNQLDLLVQISNYHDRNGGIRLNLEMGTLKSIQKKWLFRRLYDSFLFGALFIMMIYHIGLFLLRREDKSSLFFSLFCLIIATRILVTDHDLILQYIPNFSWFALLRLSYLTFYLAVPIFILFTYSLFTKYFIKWVIPVFLSISSLFSLLVLVTPTHFFTLTLSYYHIYTLILASYSIYIIFRAILNKDKSGWIFLSGFFILFFFTFLDILTANQILALPFMVPLGMFFFVFSQAYLLSTRFSRSFQTNALLTQKMKNMNLNLEKLVEDRTEELHDTNLQLTSINDRLAQQNNFKTKYLANLAHELRTPINTIASHNQFLIYDNYSIDDHLMEILDNLTDHLKTSLPDSVKSELISLETLSNLAIKMFNHSPFHIQDFFFYQIDFIYQKLTDSQESDENLAKIISILDEILILRKHEKKERLSNLKGTKSIITYLLDLIEAILNLSKIEAGKISIQPIQVNLIDFIDDIETHTKQIIIGKQKQEIIRFYSHIEVQVPENAIFDPTRIKQVLLNILTNAIKFTIEGEIHLSSSYENNQLKFQIRDTGMGIRDEDLVNIFEEFNRTESSKQIEGTGLGLALSKKLVEIHGGKITVESKLGIGSIFNIILPNVDLH